ncbi:hypothetical protein TNIN_100751, partial [Trichonephila inaurata madagascariensis]
MDKWEPPWLQPTLAYGGVLGSFELDLIRSQSRIRSR